MRLLFGLMGLLLLAFLLVFGIFIGAAMLLFAAGRRLLASRKPSVAVNQANDVIDGQFHVVNKNPVSISAK
jgi:uncharacterized protein (DUF58 family)